jgi:hypothetical protein
MGRRDQVQLSLAKEVQVDRVQGRFRAFVTPDHKLRFEVTWDECCSPYEMPRREARLLRKLVDVYLGEDG